jgi:hypothetical protein
MRASAHSPMYSRGHRVLFAQTNAAPLQCDLSSADPLAVRSLWPKVGGERSLGHMWRWAYRRSAGERGQGIHAANNLAAASLSRENREALSCPMKAVPRFCAPALSHPASGPRCPIARRALPGEEELSVKPVQAGDYALPASV